MGSWSKLGSGFLNVLIRRNKTQNLDVLKRPMSDHKVMHITASRFQYHKFKDLLHLYFWVGAIPVGLVVFYSNVYIGPAKLAPIPEDYTPKHWEYYKHPITRFIARYFLTPKQQEYEKYMHLLYEEDEKMKLRQLEDKIMQKMKARQDYQAYYYVPVDAKQQRVARAQYEEMAHIAGVNIKTED